MTKRGLLFSFCALLGLMAVWAIFRKRPAVLPEPAKSESVAQSNTGEVASPPTMGTATATTSQDPLEQLQALSKARGVTLEVLTQEAKIQLSNLQDAMTKVVNGPIEFYGEVRDENEQPIEGAHIRLSCVVFPSTQVVTNLVTDARGDFSVNGLTGAILTVQAQKERYKENGTNQSSFTYYCPLPNAGFTADKSKPVVFHMEKLQ